VIVLVQVARQVRAISLVELKRLAESYLSATSLLRYLILSEPDYLPREATLAKVEIFAKLLHEELKKG